MQDALCAAGDLGGNRNKQEERAAGFLSRHKVARHNAGLARPMGLNAEYNR
jgi:hypothetical protein